MFIKKIYLVLLATSVLIMCASCSGQDNVATVTSNPADEMATDVAFIERSVNETLAANQPRSADSEEDSSFASPTPTLAIPLTPSPASSPTATIKVYEAIIWAGPGEDYPIVIKGAKGETYEVVGKSQDDEWLIVQVDEERQGWVRLDQVKTNVELSNLVALDIPPTPEPVFTTIPTNVFQDEILLTIINNSNKSVSMRLLDPVTTKPVKFINVKPGNESVFKIDVGTYGIQFTANGFTCNSNSFTFSIDILWVVTDSFTCDQSPFR